MRANQWIRKTWAEIRANRSTRLRATGIVVSLLLALAACGGSTSSSSDKAGGSEAPEPAVLTFANNNSGLPAQLEAFANDTERLSDGTLQIEFTSDWRSGEPDQEVGTIEDVQAGEVDMAWVGARAFEAVDVTGFQALLAPFLIDSYELQGNVFADGIPAEMLESVDAIGLAGIGILPGPMRKLMGISHPFTKPADFHGQVVGTSGGVLAEQTFEALGATPKLVPAQTSLDGLDGLDYQLEAIAGNTYYETASHVTTNINLWPRPLVIVMNADQFDALAPGQQDAVRAAAANAVEPALEASRDDDAEAAAILCRVEMTAVQASDSDLAALGTAVEPVYAQLEQDADTKAFLDEIRTLKDQVAAPAESFECPEADGQATTPAAIDGVYQVTTTVEDFREAEDPQPVAENYGAWTYVFDQGRFAFTQENEDACTWGYGTYAVNGDRLEWSIIDGGGIAPNHSENKPGEAFVFGWSLYRDTLTLTAVPGEISPENFFVKPWRLTGMTPSAAVLSARCPPPPEALQPGD